MSNANLKYVTSFKDRHGKRRYFFRANGKKYPLQGQPGEPEFHSVYANLLAKREANALGRAEPLFLKGSIGAVIEAFLASDQFTDLAASTQRNYRRVLDVVKTKLGPARLADLE